MLLIELGEIVSFLLLIFCIVADSSSVTWRVSVDAVTVVGLETWG